jgi:predicted signal transduction protein with EAL and GGDEF domain
VAEKVRAAVDTIYLANLDQKVTASLGVASLPEDCGDADTLIRSADRALDAAKGRGRNRVELFESGHEAARRPPAPGPSHRPGRTRGRWSGPR